MRWGLSRVTPLHTFTGMLGTVTPLLPQPPPAGPEVLCPCQFVWPDPQQHLRKVGITILFWSVNKLTQRGKGLPERGVSLSRHTLVLQMVSPVSSGHTPMAEDVCWSCLTSSTVPVCKFNPLSSSSQEVLSISQLKEGLREEVGVMKGKSWRPPFHRTSRNLLCYFQLYRTWLPNMSHHGSTEK